MADSPKEEVSQIVPKKTNARTSIIHLITSFFRKLGTAGAIYLLGYFELSIAWLAAPVILSVLRDEWKKESEAKRINAQIAATSNEKDLVLAKLDDLPAWVFFPDVERAEWLNVILKQMWPNINHYMYNLIKDTIEPSIRENLVQYKLKNFQFGKIRLGAIPPRIGGIKVYEKHVARDEIIMDMEISYAGDCDISFTVSGVSGGIKDFQIHGMMRVIMKPLIPTIPLVGGVQMFFLNNPTLDFNLVGALDMLDAPGLSDMLHRIVVEQIGAMMVLPNKLPIILSTTVPSQTLKTPQPEGVLRIHVVEGKHLMAKDMKMVGKNTSDPYVILTLGAQTYRTPTIDSTLDPKWDYWCEMVVYSSRGQELALQLYDEDKLKKKDSSLGKATVDIHNVVKKGGVDSWVTLEEATHGMVHLRLSWLTITKDTKLLATALAETQLLRVTSMSSALLTVYVDSAKNLPNARTQSKPDPYVSLNVGNKVVKTNVQYRTDCPVFEQGFTLLVGNPETDSLRVKIFDQKTEGEIGRLDFTLEQLLEKKDLEISSEPFTLQKAGSDSKIILSMQLRILKTSEMAPQPAITRTASQMSRNRSIGSRTSSSSSMSVILPGGGGGNAGGGDTVKSTVPEETEDKIDSANGELKPVTENMTIGTPPYAVKSAPYELHQRSPSVTGSMGPSKLGRIYITLRYSVQRQRLIVVIHKIANLPKKDPSNIPDPYVKLYLLPERSKETKRKTETIKDDCNPIYEESFEYTVSQGVLSSKQLEVTVVNQHNWYSAGSPVIGQVIIDLDQVDPNGEDLTDWFDLQHESTSKD
nr:PREDICTED: extended synaptotagmin-2 [Bemisia tabaci]